MEVIKSKEFANGKVYALKLDDSYLIETTDTFLPYYTKDAINQKQNCLQDYQLGSRDERWMIGVSVMSGCPVGCRFCATGQMKKCRNLKMNEIIDQLVFILDENPKQDPNLSKEFKINYTRMGEPFLNIDNVRQAISCVDNNSLNTTVHHYISTIGIKDSDFSWIKDNITLQISLHSLNEEKRNWLIPYKNKMSIKELGQIRTKSNLKTTLNLTLVDENDFDINILKEYFDPEYFFIKLSPINPNTISNKNNLGLGVIEQINLV
jgi:adenine C2-methylase RlmN of 23S rRNA A2503 and tRNA A37